MKNKSKEVLNKKRGISLIVLVITILVILILATTIILNLVSNNVISKARETVFKSDSSTMQEELEMYIMNKDFESLRRI